jgi:hypothetical protein
MKLTPEAAGREATRDEIKSRIVLHVGTFLLGVGCTIVTLVATHFL